MESFIGRGINSVAEQLKTTTKKAQEIQDKIFKGFPAIKQFEEDSRKMAVEKGFVTTLWGRKRRLPEIQLPKYEFDFSKKQQDNFNPLDFDNDNNEEYIDYDAIDKYTRLMDRAFGRIQKEEIKAKARAEGIEIKDNGGYIADAERQCVNARIQRFGSRYVKKSNDISWQ